MRTRVVALCSMLSSFGLGLPVELNAQGGPVAPRSVEHRVAVVVPLILSVDPPAPGSPDRAWRVRTNDPILRRRLLKGVSIIRGVGDTLQVTIAPP